MIPPKETVRRGYDLVSEAYRRADFDFERSGYSRVLAWLVPHIGRGTKALDIGCGCGIPVARHLVRSGCRVLGLDISNVQVSRATDLVPDAEFVCQDATEAEFEREAFDLIVAFYSIIHIPLSEQRGLLSRVASWMTPGGLLLCTVGDEEADGYIEKDWLGVPGGDMFWSHTTRETYLAWLSQEGLEVLREDELVDSGGGRHPVVLARKLGP